MRHTMSDEKKTKTAPENEPVLIPLSYVMQFEVFFDPERGEKNPEIVKDVKKAFIAAIGDVVGRYREVLNKDEGRMVLVNLFKTGDMEMI
jgi:hypothetical protein